MTLENKPIEIDLLIIADNPGVREELQAFEEKSLFQNPILGPAITSERKNVVLVKFREGDKAIKNTIRQLQGINITEAIFAEKNFARHYQGQEVWLVEKAK
ncbi:30592_t:CDS:2, partial [Racocetra persica]